MQVAISRMEYVSQPKLILRCDPVACCEHLGQTRTRNHRILDHRVRCDAPDCSKGAFPRRPEFLPFGFVVCEPATAGSVFEAKTFDALCFIVDSCFDPVQLD